MRPRRIAALLALVAVLPVAARSQNISAAAREQIRGVAGDVGGIASPAAAQAAGYQEALGWLPTMGTHYVNNGRMLDSRRFDMNAPDQLMFSRIAGHDSLVGAAYAYLAPLGDADRPATFDGNPPWHEHPNLAPAGMTLVMLHVWFVPSPDGPFAGHNPNLPYWAIGMTPPDEARLRDPVGGPRLRKLALALGEVVDSAGLFPLLARRSPLLTGLPELRQQIRVLVPELQAAQRAGDASRFDRAADRMIEVWESMRDRYLSAAPSPLAHERMEHFLAEMTGAGHGEGGHHH